MLNCILDDKYLNCILITKTFINMNNSRWSCINKSLDRNMFDSYCLTVYLGLCYNGV